MEFPSSVTLNGGVLLEHRWAALFALVTQDKLWCQLVHTPTSWNEHTASKSLRGRRAEALLSEALVLLLPPPPPPKMGKNHTVWWALLGRVFGAGSEQGTTQIFWEQTSIPGSIAHLCRDRNLQNLQFFISHF